MKKRKYKSKSRTRSQSGIITIVLLILMAIVALVIVWNIIVPIIKNSSEEIKNQPVGVSGSIKYSLVPRQDNAIVEINRDAGEGNISGVKLIFQDSNGKTYIYNNSIYPRPLETITYNITNDSLGIVNFTNIIKVSLLFLYTVNGKEKTTAIIDEKTL